MEVDGELARVLRELVGERDLRPLAGRAADRRARGRCRRRSTSSSSCPATTATLASRISIAMLASVRTGGIERPLERARLRRGERGGEPVSGARPGRGRMPPRRPRRRRAATGARTCAGAGVLGSREFWHPCHARLVYSVTSIVPCMPACTAQMNVSVVPGSAVTFCGELLVALLEHHGVAADLEAALLVPALLAGLGRVAPDLTGVEVDLVPLDDRAADARRTSSARLDRRIRLGRTFGFASENVCGPIFFGLVLLTSFSFAPDETLAGPSKNRSLPCCSIVITAVSPSLSATFAWAPPPTPIATAAAAHRQPFRREASWLSSLVFLSSAAACSSGGCDYRRGVPAADRIPPIARVSPASADGGQNTAPGGVRQRSVAGSANPGRARRARRRPSPRARPRRARRSQRREPVAVADRDARPLAGASARRSASCPVASSISIPISRPYPSRVAS